MAAPLKSSQRCYRDSMGDYELAMDTDYLLASDTASEQLVDVHDVHMRKKIQYSREKSIVIGGLLVVFLLLIAIPLRKKFHEDLPALPEPVITHLQPDFFTEYNSERVRINYGPFSVPPNSVHNGMKNFEIMNAQMPCHGCLITWFHAGLEYPDGSSADAATGLWLHHTVLANAAKRDTKGCKYNERFFASGNERTVVDMTLNGTEKAGYWLGDSDKVTMLTELMNENKDPQVAVLTITYEYISYIPSDFETVTSIWLDIGGCDRSDQPVPKNEKQFQFSSPMWESTISGRVISVLSHLHDGGVALDVKCEGETICESIPAYEDVMHHEEMRTRMDMNHISSMPICYNTGHLHKGHELTVQANYDLSSHSPMLKGDGQPEGVMGIAILYVVEG